MYVFNSFKVYLKTAEGRNRNWCNVGEHCAPKLRSSGAPRLPYNRSGGRGRVRRASSQGCCLWGSQIVRSHIGFRMDKKRRIGLRIWCARAQWWTVCYKGVNGWAAGWRPHHKKCRDGKRGTYPSAWSVHPFMPNKHLFRPIPFPTRSQHSRQFQPHSIAS